MVRLLAIGALADACVQIDDEEYCITSIETEDQAIQQIKKTTPDLILLNIKQSSSFAKALLKLIKSQARTKYIPVILLVNEQNEYLVDFYYDDGITIGIKENASVEMIVLHSRQLLGKVRQNRKKIMVIDDDEIARTIINRFLHPRYQVINARNATEAYTYLEKNTVDLIIMDIMMPDISGIELFKKLQVLKNAKEVPILFQTSVSDENTVKECLKLGPVGYLVKPIKKEELLCRIEFVLTYGMKKVYVPTPPRTILYIDKNEANIASTRSMLKAGFEFCSASGCILPINMMEQKKVDIVMINMDNSSFCYHRLEQKIRQKNQERKRNDKDEKQIKLILITSNYHMFVSNEDKDYMDATIMRYPLNREVLVETLDSDL